MALKEQTPPLINKTYIVQNSSTKFNKKKENSNAKMATNYRTNSLAAEIKWTTST